MSSVVTGGPWLRASLQRLWGRSRRYLPIALGMMAMAGLFMALLCLRNAIQAGADLDSTAYWRAGRAVLAGTPVYTGLTGDRGVFLYAPPLAIAAIPLGLLPLPFAKLVLFIVSMGSLRYLTGSWRMTFIACLLPGTLSELFFGQVNLLCCAAIVAAFRGQSGALMVVGLAKLFPFAAVPQLLRRHRPMREFVLIGLLALAMTLPFLGLWSEWWNTVLGSLAGAGRPAAQGWLPGPRLVLAVVLLGVGWLRRNDPAAATGVVLSTRSAIGIETALLMLIVPLRVWWDQRLGAKGARSSQTAP
jgi:hypothetical protein